MRAARALLKTTISLLSLTTLAEGQAAPDVCSLIVELAAQAESEGEIVLVESQESSSYALIPTGLPVADDIDWYRVTSGFFTESGVLGIANAGMYEVVVLDSIGSVVSRIGNQGPGPEEFSMLFFARLRPRRGTVVAFDAGAGVAKEFTLDGELVRSATLGNGSPSRPYDVFPLEDGRFVVQHASVANDRYTPGEVTTTSVPLTLTDSAGTIERMIAQISGPERVRVVEPDGRFATFDRPFATRPWAIVDAGGCLLYPDNEDAGLIVRSIEDSFSVRVSLPFVNAAVDVDAWKARIARHRTSGHDFPNLPVPENGPAWSSGKFDGKARLWLEIYHHFSEPTPGWWVVDLETGSASHVPAPAGAATLIAATQERAAIVVRDENDEEHVTLFDIRDF